MAAEGKVKGQSIKKPPYLAAVPSSSGGGVEGETVSGESEANASAVSKQAWLSHSHWYVVLLL